MLERLHEASQDLPEFTPYAKRKPQQPTPQNYQQAKQQQYSQAFREDDGVEVIENKTQVVESKNKYGRNDLVVVISPD